MIIPEAVFFVDRFERTVVIWLLLLALFGHGLGVSCIAHDLRILFDVELKWINYDFFLPCISSFLVVFELIVNLFAVHDKVTHNLRKHFVVAGIRHCDFVAEQRMVKKCIPINSHVWILLE